jgi:hypothetical protein
MKDRAYYEALFAYRSVSVEFGDRNVCISASIHSIYNKIRARWDLNPRPPAPQADALSILGHGPTRPLNPGCFKDLNEYAYICIYLNT